MKRLYIFLLSIFLFSGVIISNASSDYIVDDRSELLNYSGSTSRIYIDNAKNGGVTRVNSGSSVTFDFYGSRLNIYCAQYRNSGNISVYIDDEKQGTYDCGRSVNYRLNQLVFGVSDLEAGEHTCTIICTSDYVTDAYNNNSVSPYFYLDYIVADSDYKDYYLNSFDILLVFISSLLIFICVVQSLTFWRSLRNDN